MWLVLFFFNDTATTEIYTLSLHDALPISRLRWIVGKMDERYKLLQARQVRSIEGYNKAVSAEERLPYWVVVVDELADLMMASAGEGQTSPVRLAPDRRGRRHPPSHADPPAPRGAGTG